MPRFEFVSDNQVPHYIPELGETVQPGDVIEVDDERAESIVSEQLRPTTKKPRKKALPEPESAEPAPEETEPALEDPQPEPQETPAEPTPEA